MIYQVSLIYPEDWCPASRVAPSFPEFPSLVVKPCAVLSHFECGLRLVIHFWNRAEYYRNGAAPLWVWVRSSPWLHLDGLFFSVGLLPCCGGYPSSLRRSLCSRRLRSGQRPGRNWGQQQPWTETKKGVPCFWRPRPQLTAWLQLHEVIGVRRAQQRFSRATEQREHESLLQSGVICYTPQNTVAKRLHCFIGLSSLSYD